MSIKKYVKPKYEIGQEVVCYSEKSGVYPLRIDAIEISGKYIFYKMNAEGVWTLVQEELTICLRNDTDHALKVNIWLTTYYKKFNTIILGNNEYKILYDMLDDPVRDNAQIQKHENQAD